MNTRAIELGRQRLIHDGLRFDVLFKKGHPVKRILETAQDEEIDLIVMGRGLSELAGAFRDSVSHRVAHGADCSVITVK